MTTSEPREELVCDTTPVRHFALAGHFNLLVRLVGGVVRVPRPVFDPDEDPDGIESLLSEIGQSERYWVRRSKDPDKTEKWSRLRGLRQRQDIEVIDLEDDELTTYAELQTPGYARTLNFAAPLGPGEAAVIAIAENRGWDAVIDDAEGRSAFADRVPGGRVFTSRELIRAGVADELLTSSEAAEAYMDLLDGRYRGPETLWQ